MALAFSDGRVVAPDLVRQSRHRDDLVGVHEQDRQEGALARATEARCRIVHKRLERPEYAELDSHAERA